MNDLNALDRELATYLNAMVLVIPEFLGTELPSVPRAIATIVEESPWVRDWHRSIFLLLKYDKVSAKMSEASVHGTVDYVIEQFARRVLQEVLLTHWRQACAEAGIV